MYSTYEMARNAKGMSDYDVSKKTGITASTISDWKNGKIKTLKVDKLVLIARALDISLDYLVTGAKTPTEPLSNSERELLRLFRSLSSTGQSAALTMLEGLLNNPTFAKEKNQNIQIG